MKRIISMLLTGIMLMSSVAFAATFEDVNDKHENYEAIEVLQTIEVVSGYSKEVYGPDRILNRAELCTLLVKALYADDIHYGYTTFTDVGVDHWARKYIDTAVEHKLMVGYGNFTFGPEDEVTYTQVARTILNALGYGNLAWPTGVDAVALELNLYDNIDTKNYDKGCTRAHAAQMIYNAFELNTVKTVAGITTENKDIFLTKLGYRETTKYEDGRIYLAYENLDKNVKPANKIKVTDILVSYEEEIEYVSDNEYKLTSDKKAKAHEFDWAEVVLFINGKEVDATKANKAYFKNGENVIGSFDEDDNLIAIFVEYEGVAYTPNEFSKLPSKVRAEIEKEDNYNAKTSTITYFFEDESYEISNDILCGFVTKRNNKTVTINGKKASLGTGHGIDVDDYAVIYYDVEGEIAGWEILPIDEVYFYDIDNMIVHTWECVEYNDNSDDDCWMVWSEINAAENLLEGEDFLKFEADKDCHAEGTEDKYLIIVPKAPVVAE